MPGIREAMGANVATIVVMLFMVQQASAQEAQALAARMLAALDARSCQYGDIQLRYTSSAGVSIWDGAEALQTAVQRADQARYRAKAGGRSRVDLACPV